MSDTDAASSFINVSDPSQSQPSIIDAPSNGDDELDSLPSEPDSDEVTISDDFEDSDAEKEWQESLQQLELLLSMVIVPYLGKYFGRKFAYWGWKQYMEWNYPVKVEITNKAAFKGIGAIEAAASL